MSDVARLARECAALLGDARDLVLKLDDERYAAPGPGGTSSVGAHLRHAVEICAALVGGIPAGRVDYDRRPRDPRIECEPRFALERIEALRAALEERVARETDRALAVRSDEPELVAGDGFLHSSLARELRAVASHTVHHFAVIALQLRCAGIALDRRFGMAPSTRAHACAAQSASPSGASGPSMRSGRTMAS